MSEQDEAQRAADIRKLAALVAAMSPDQRLIVAAKWRALGAVHSAAVIDRVSGKETH